MYPSGSSISSSAIPALLWRAPWRVSPCARLAAQGAGPDSLRTLSNVKGNRSAPSLSARVTCPHSSQTNRSEPTMCVSAIPWAQSCKCRCAVTFPQPKHSFVTICFLITRQSRTQRNGPLRTRRHRWELSWGTQRAHMTHVSLTPRPAGIIAMAIVCYRLILKDDYDGFRQNVARTG